MPDDDRRPGESVLDCALRTSRIPPSKAEYWRAQLDAAGPSRVVASAGGATGLNAVEELIMSLHPCPPPTAEQIASYLRENPT